MRDLERIRHVTQNYERLQGLRYAPMAMWLALWGVASVFFFEEPRSFFDVQPLRDGAYLASFFFATWLSGVVGGYYERRLGRVRQRREWIHPLGPTLLVGALVVAFVVGNPSVRDDVGQPVLGVIAGLLFAGFILYNWWPRRGRLTAYWPALAGLGFGASLLPLGGTFSGGEFPLLIALLGVMMTAGLIAGSPPAHPHFESYS